MTVRRRARGRLKLALCGHLVACDAEPPPATVQAPSQLAGEVVFVEEHGPPDFRFAALDLATMEVTTLFELPPGAFAHEIDVHPETGAVLFSYTEPAGSQEPGFDRSAVFVLDEHGSYDWVAGEDRSGSWAVAPRWSADGRFVWYASTHAGLAARGVAHAVVRASADTGEIDRTIDWATEPAVSPDGERMAWIGVDPTTGVRSVQLGTADGSHPQTLLRDTEVADVGHPMFSADGQHLYVFVPEAVVPRAADLRAPTAPFSHALHTTPGDWYSVDLETHRTRRLTHLQTIQYAASLYADGDGLCVATRKGIELASLEPPAVQELMFNRAIRALAWRPPRAVRAEP